MNNQDDPAKTTLKGLNNGKLTSDIKTKVGKQKLRKRFLRSSRNDECTEKGEATATMKDC